MQTHYLRIDDVTESTAAGNSAQIAQTASATVTDLAAQVQDNKNLTAQYLDATESAKNEAVAASGTAVTASQDAAAAVTTATQKARSEEHTSELQSLMRISYAVFCLKKKNKKHNQQSNYRTHYTQSHR